MGWFTGPNASWTQGFKGHGAIHTAKMGLSNSAMIDTHQLGQESKSVVLRSVSVCSQDIADRLS